MAEQKYEHGKMNTEVQEKTFEGFMRWVTNGAIVVVIILIILALTGT